MPTITVKVSAGVDDGFVQKGMLFNNVIMVDIGYNYKIAGKSDAFLRFTSVNIPKGMTITSAKLRFLSAQTLAEPTVNWLIQAEATANPIPADYDYYDRPRTVASVPWHDVPPWISGWYESPNLASVIQEIINLPDWIAGNAMQLFVQDDGSHDSVAKDSECIRRAWAYEQNPEYAAELEITYEEAPPPQYTLTISATAGGTTDLAPNSYLYNEGTVVTVTALPDTGYTFNHWELDGVTVSTETSYNVTMDADHTLHAVFSPAPPAKGFLEVHTYIK